MSKPCVVSCCQLLSASSQSSSSQSSSSQSSSWSGYAPRPEPTSRSSAHPANLRLLPTLLHPIFLICPWPYRTSISGTDETTPCCDVPLKSLHYTDYTALHPRLAHTLPLGLQRWPLSTQCTQYSPLPPILGRCRWDRRDCGSRKPTLGLPKRWPRRRPRRRPWRRPWWRPGWRPGWRRGAGPAAQRVPSSFWDSQTARQRKRPDAPRVFSSFARQASLGFRAKVVTGASRGRGGPSAVRSACKAMPDKVTEGHRRSHGCTSSLDSMCLLPRPHSVSPGRPSSLPHVRCQRA